MKKKILLISLMVAMLTCIFALSISATTYNYYENEVAEENLLYSAVGELTNEGRYEVTTQESGDGFAKYDEQGNPLSWYVVSDTTDESGVRNIVVKSALTIGGVGTVDENGAYTYGGGAVADVTAKKIVSANFFGTGVKTLPASVFLATANGTPAGSNNSSEYCRIADANCYLLCLYLPKTLTQISSKMCQRSPIRVIEFEDGVSEYKTIPSDAFNFCSNLKAISIPEGITTLATKTFRECLSVSYVKFPSTMTRLEADLFWRAYGFETVVLGENMTYAGPLSNTYNRFYLGSTANSVKMKYIYVPNTINTPNSKFDSYRGADKEYVEVDRSVVFFFVGTIEEARVVAGFTDRHFSSAVAGLTSAKNSNTKGEEPVTYTKYLSNKEYYDNLPTDRHLLVYNVPVCVAFHDGQHDMEHKNTYTDALTPFSIGDYCKNCGYSENVTEYEPILEFLGYSAKIDGDQITLGYKVNKDSLAIYPNISYGVLAVIPGENADMTAYEPLNPDLTPAVDNKVISLAVDKKYSDFNLILNSFSSDTSYYEIPVVMCAYVTDGEKVDYICHNKNNELYEVVQQEYATSVTFKFIAEECVPKYLVSFSCNDTMGTISGTASQIVADGNKASAVTAIAKEGYTFACWSDGTTTPTIEYAPKEDTELVAYFTPKSTGLPVMTINTDGGIDITTKEYYINCEITILDTETGNSIGGKVAEIKGRGNSTWDLEKKPYKFKFDKKQDLFGYGSEKTWVLLADHRDYSLLRNMLALNAGLTLSELKYTSEGQSVELYVNGEYRGVYYLCEQIQIKDNRVDITQEDDEIEQKPEDLGYLIEMDGWVADQYGGAGNVPTMGVTPDGDVFVRVDDSLRNGYVIKDPEDILFDEDGNLKTEYLTYIQNYLVSCLSVASGDDYDAVCELIDVKSFAQAYIIYELFKNPDTNYSSVYFYKDAGGKLVCGPLWDFDMGIGNVSHKGNGVFESTETLWTAEKNTWFRELLEFEDFRVLVGQELAENADAIRASIATDIEYAREHATAYKNNFEEWDILGESVWSNPSYLIEIETWEEHLEYIEEYLEASLTYLIETYPAPVAE